MQIRQSQIVDVVAHETVIISAPCNIYGCTFNEGVFIGPFCEIQSNVLIGKRTRVQSHTFICSNVSIGCDGFVGHHVCFINDNWASGERANGDRSKWGKTSIGDRVLIGSGAIIFPVRIADDVIVGAGTLVNKDIVESGVYVGNPMRKIK